MEMTPENDIPMNLEIMSNRIDALDTELKEKVKYLIGIISQLKASVDYVTTENENLQARIAVLEERKAKASHTEFKAQMSLQDEKQAFLNTYPTKQTGEDWPNHYFVFWYSYLRGMHYPKAPDMLPSMRDVYIREKKGIQKIFKYYTEVALANNIPGDTEMLDKFIRRRTKMFIEYMLINVNVPDKPCPEFWQVCSEWALTNFGHKLATWHKIANLEDKPLD